MNYIARLSLMTTGGVILVLSISSCAHDTAIEHMQISYFIDQDNPIMDSLIKRVKEYYTYLEDKDWGSIYDILSEKRRVTIPRSRSEFIKAGKTQTWIGGSSWEFVSLAINSIELKNDRAYVEVIYITKDGYSSEVQPPQTWKDEWILEDGVWNLFMPWK